MDSRQLGYFCAVVRLGSFTKAAAACHISQSAISQQVRALEADLGCTLLERRGRHFSPTQAGALLARKGETLLDEFAQLEAETYDIAHGKPRHLTFGYLSRYDGWEVAGAVAAYARRHPGCQIETVAASHDQLYRDASAERPTSCSTTGVARFRRNGKTSTCARAGAMRRHQKQARLPIITR